MIIAGTAKRFYGSKPSFLVGFIIAFKPKAKTITNDEYNNTHLKNKLT